MKIISKLFLLIASLILVAGCSSGGSESSINTPVPGGTVQSTLTIAKTSLSPGESTEVTALLTADGKPLVNQLVTFTATPDLAAFSPASGQKLTNASGEATVTMIADKTVTGVGQVTVSATVNGAPVTQIAPFYVNTTALKLANLVIQPTVITVGDSAFVTVDIMKDGKKYTDQDVDVYFNAQYGWFEANNAVGKVRSSGGQATSRYRVAVNLYNKVTDTITVTLGASTVSGYLVVNPPPVVAPEPGAGALKLAVAPAAVKPGDFITATITYTNTDATMPVSGVPVSIVSSRPDIILSDSSVTDSAGIAQFNLQVASSATPTTVSLYASSGSVQSLAQTVTVGAAAEDKAELKLTMSDTATWEAPSTGVVIAGNNVSFVTSQGLPVVGKRITLDATLVDGYYSPFIITLNGTRLSDSATPLPSVDVVTDSTGTAVIPTLIEGSIPSNYVVYWRARTDGYVAYAYTTVTVPAPLPNELPGPPIMGTATAINPTEVDVTFAPPAYPGTSAITGYTVTASPNLPGMPALVITDLNANTPVLTHSITGLKSGTTYTFNVYATNSSGNGPFSSPSKAITTTPPPPVIGSAYVVNATRVDVTFTAPSTDAAAIIGYTVVANPGGVVDGSNPTLTDTRAGTLGTLVVDPPDPAGTYRHRISGLTTGLPYTFSVFATTAAGNSSYSAPTNSVTPSP